MQVASLSILRALHVIPSVSAADGGPTRAVMLMERALRDLGVQVTTLTTDHDSASVHTRALAATQSERVYVRMWASGYKIAPGIVPYLARQIRAFDVVHIHALFSFTSTIAAWAAQVSGIPYVIRPLGTMGSYGMTKRRPRLKQVSMLAIEAPILRRAAAVHFTSHAEAAEASRLGIAFRSVVIPLGVEPITVRASSGIENHRGRRCFLFLSRLDPKKNVESLIDAVAKLGDQQQDNRLVIGGDGAPSYVQELKARAERAGIGRRVTWLGHVEGARKAAALASADIFVLPSLSENFGIAGVEAMLAGLPCVLSPGVAIANDVAEAGAGLVAGPDPESLAGAIAQLLANDTLRLDMSRRAQAFASDTYSTAAMGCRLVDLYSSICRGERSVQQ